MVILGPLVLALLGAGFYLFTGRKVETDNAYIKADKTSISAEVQGKVIQVNVKDNMRVHKGDVLFLIDPEPFQIAVRQAEAALSSVRTEIESMRADYQQKKAELARAEESVRYRRKEYNRFRDLAARKVIPKEKGDQARYDFNAAEKERDAARQEAEADLAKLGGNPDISTEEHPRYKEARAALEKAQLDLARVKVTAPSDGVVAHVDLEPGEYTAPGLPLFTLLDDSHPWVEANFKETDLTYVRPGQPARVTVDTYPGVIWHGRVVTITPATGAEFSILPPQNSSGNWVKVVQRIMVRVELADSSANPPLAAGMSSVVSVDTGANRIVRRLSSAAPAE
jgi:membrane fusion protein (multidrug efflux system)